MGDSDVKIDFGVPASLRKWPSLKNERVPKSWGGVPYFVADGTLDECIRDFMSKPTSQHHLYEIHTAPQGASERGSVGRAYCRIGSAAGFSLGASVQRHFSAAQASELFPNTSVFVGCVRDRGPHENREAS